MTKLETTFIGGIIEGIIYPCGIPTLVIKCMGGIKRPVEVAGL